LVSRGTFFSIVAGLGAASSQGPKARFKVSRAFFPGGRRMEGEGRSQPSRSGSESERRARSGRLTEAGGRQLESEMAVGSASGWQRATQ
jgi:hypothetical protein